jgi:hypothetical protein
MVRLAPVVDSLAVVADDMTVTRTVGVHRTTVEEFEPFFTAPCSLTDLDLLALELVTAGAGCCPFRLVLGDLSLTSIGVGVSVTTPATVAASTEGLPRLWPSRYDELSR